MAQDEDGFMVVVQDEVKKPAASQVLTRRLTLALTITLALSITLTLTLTPALTSNAKGDCHPDHSWLCLLVLTNLTSTLAITMI